MNRPVLRYFGGKWRLAPWVISHFPAHRRYVEPFGGAASVLLRKEPAYNEIYNDLDHSVVSFFRVVRSPWKRAALQAALRLTPYSRDEFVAARRPARFSVEAARRLCVRSFMGHSTSGISHRDTGFRSESNDVVKSSSQVSGFRAVPDLIDQASKRFQSVVIESMDALAVIEKYTSSETLIYCDPPYQFSTRIQKGLRQYRHEMSDKQHQVLMDCLAASESMVVLSGYPGSVYDGLGWECSDCLNWTVGGVRTERLWLNPLVSERLEREQAFEQLEMEAI